MKTKILVCGDRNYNDPDYLFEVLDDFDDLYGVEVVIEGEARGADTFGRKWGEQRGKIVLPYPADWETHGKAAGPIRNTQMLKEGLPDYVLAFHKDIFSSKGTANMVKQATGIGVPVLLYGGSY